MLGNFFYFFNSNPFEEPAAEGSAEIAGLGLCWPRSEELGQGEGQREMHHRFCKAQVETGQRRAAQNPKHRGIVVGWEFTLCIHFIRSGKGSGVFKAVVFPLSESNSLWCLNAWTTG